MRILVLTMYFWAPHGREWLGVKQVVEASA